MDLTGVILLAVGLGLGVAFGLLMGRARTATALASADARVAALEATLEHERKAAAERTRLAEQSQQQLAAQFSQLSADALRQNNEQFLALAAQRLSKARAEAAGELEQRKQAVEGMVKPLQEALAKVETQLLTVEKERSSAYAALRTQVQQIQTTSDQLRQETASLVNALRAPQVRGRWGELQLRRAVELAGMVEHCDFVEQATTSGEDGVLRPDMVVKIAGGKQVVVDAKVPFAGYLEAMEARDEATREARLRAHARHLREHIDRLAAKAYWDRFESTPEFVVLFVPADAFLHAALEQDPTLMEHAFERNVVLTTPANLIALLRTVGYAWRQEALAANAQQVFSLGRELHGRLATMGGHLSRLGSQLEGAVKTYNSTVSSMESRVLVTARRFCELKVTDDELAGLDQIDTTPRQVQAPELVASASDALIAWPELVQEAKLLKVERESPSRNGGTSAEAT